MQSLEKHLNRDNASAMVKVLKRQEFKNEEIVSGEPILHQIEKVQKTLNNFKEVKY